MGLSLKKLGKTLFDVLGEGADAIIPGNQAYLHQSSPVAQTTNTVVKGAQNLGGQVSRAVQQAPGQALSAIRPIAAPGIDAVSKTLPGTLDAAKNISNIAATINPATQPIMLARAALDKVNPNLSGLYAKPSEFAQSVVQAIPKAGARLTNTINDTVTTPTGNIEKALLGDKPVGQFKDYTQEGFGAKTGNQFLDSAIGALGSAVDVGLPGAPKVVAPTLRAATSATKPVVRLAENAAQAYKNNPLLNEAGFIGQARQAGKFAPGKNIHPEDLSTMTDFIDYTRGAYRPTPQAAQQLELDAARVAEHYNIPMAKDVNGLANNFDSRIQTSPNLLDRIKAPLQNEGGFVKLPGKSTPESVKNPSVAQSLEAPKSGSHVNDYTDYLVNKYIGGEAPRVKLRNPITRGLTQAQEVYRGGVDKARDLTSDTLLKGITSESPIISKVAGAPSVGFNRYGLKDSTRQILQARNGQQENAGRVVKQVSENLGASLEKLPNPQQSLQNIDRFFEQPDYLARAYGDGTKLKLDQLAPEERKVAETMIDFNKLRNDINLEVGNISPELHAKYADGTHSPRIYDLETGKASGSNLFNTGVKKQRVPTVSDDVFDKREVSPILRSMVRAEIALRDKATFDALKSLQETKLIREKAPNNSFSKLEGSRYGKFAGQYIYNPVRSELDRAISYNTKGGKAVGDLIDAYQGTKLGSLDRFFKSTKTTLSPATFLGNVASNPIAFNSAAGVNPLTQSKNMAKASVKLVKDAHGKFDRSLYEARKQGVGVNDTGRQLTGERRVELSTGKKTTKNPYKMAQAVYGAADQAAQVALYDELVKRGLSPELAARRVSLGTQDYGGAGRGVQNLADSPILGKPFARFTPELVRLTKNNLLYNPAGTAAKVGLAAAGADKLSKASGETEEERNARETAVGQTTLPGTGFINKAVTGRDANLSLNVPVNGSAVNIARLTGLNYPTEPGGDANGAFLRQLNPVADLTRKDAQGNTKFAPAQGVSSLTFKPLADQVANRDFMGRNITDPDNKTYVEGVGDKGKKYAGAPSESDQTKSRLTALAAGYVPLFNEGNAIASASENKKDYYGKERTVNQALLRAAGIKAESNSKEARQSRLETQDFFEGKQAQVNKFLRENPDLKDAYTTLTSNTRTRDTNTKTRDIISPEKWSVIKGDNTGKLYSQLKTEALDANKKGQPIDPIFQLSSPERIKEVTELRSRPTGDDIEREEILRATQPWYPAFEKAETAYYAANDKYFQSVPKGTAKPNPRVEAYNNVPYPEQSDLIKRYYEVKANQGDDVGKQFFKDNADQLSADFDTYKGLRLKQINAKRAIEGVSPISTDTFNNVTFGYEDDERKVARDLYYKLGGGGGSGGSGGKKTDTNPYKYAVDLNAGGAVAKPKVSLKKNNAAKSKIAKPSAPKVSIKKSRV